MNPSEGYKIQKQDGSQHGPYNIRVIKAFIVAGKFKADDLLETEEGAIPLATVPELHGLWGKSAGVQVKPDRLRETPFESVGALPQVPSRPDLNSTRRPTVPGRVVFYRGKVLPPGPNPSYAGSLHKNSVLKMLYRLMLSKKTGRVHFRQNRETVDLFLEYGIPAYAVSERNETRLGELMVSSGLLSRSQLTWALDLGASKGRPLGQILLQEKLVSGERLRFAFLRQLKERIFEVFRWRDGIYRFYEGQVTGCEFPIDPDPFLLMKEGAILHTPNAIIDNQLFEFRNKRVARLLHPNLSIDDFQLSEAEKSLYKSISNQDPLNDLCATAVERGWFSEEGALRLVYLLWQVDLLKMGEEMIGERTRRQIEQLKMLSMKLEKQSRLERLGLRGGASPDEIRSAYLGFAKLYHPDQLPPGTHPTVTKHAEEVFALIAESYRSLN